MELQQTVTGILKSSNLETATELSVRQEAEKLLGIDLSDLKSKQLVRRIVESYLLSADVPAESVAVNDCNVGCDDDGRFICQLPDMCRVSVKKFKKIKLLSIKEYDEKQGKVIPSGREITLNPKEWSKLHSSFPDIEEAITKMESSMRGEEGIEKKQTEAATSNHSASLASEPRGRERLQTESDTSVVPPHPLIPIATTRFSGKNYYCWRCQMEFFINQLKISYVLVRSCPKIPFSPQASFEEITRAKSYAQKWINDDYICRHTILNSLSDQLFDQYSVKTLNAKELWDELKSLYDEDFGTNIAHVNNYIEFQMVDGVSVLEQVHELHRIAGTITTSGIHIDEKFHVGVIISKLPPSWKHVRAKLMQEEHLPLDKLIYMLKEEDFRGQQKRESGLNQKDKRRLCLGCHKEGHIERDCPLRRSYRRYG